ncbi:unnamed protein product [Didymodactylos carnosus]|uniref:Toll-interacting protein n=1 Tax=Didymodactylos carnosus TaxID=1234261 RepID=A0A813PJ62_9BILA|nr:unnamed protein product [Didymodactylos carnosus]CAF1333121.1 unnamed protein product [Didymodactylos carnosus]CAF3530936.1 unnamed protein product [Didymodactylos carnosus]CAF4144458.1 unnamed protein product [Didymodactylos carnosus]
MASASAYAANSFAATASNYVNSGSASATNNDSAPKFDEYRSRVMLGDLPDDFLRIQLTRTQFYYDPHAGVLPQFRQAPHPLQNPNFVGYLTLTIAEAKVIKNFGLLGLLKMDPYVRIRLGHIAYETPTAQSGGKNPQWKASYRINLFKGMDAVYLEVFDRRSFTEDEFIGECNVPITQEVLNGETKQSWYTLLGKQNQNEGDILIIMSFVPHQAVQQPNLEHQVPSTLTNTNSGMGTAIASPQNEVPSATPTSLSQSPTRSTSTIPKTQPPDNIIHQQQIAQTHQQQFQLYSPNDVKELHEIFPTVEQSVIKQLLDTNGGNKDLVVNHLLQMTSQ